MICILNLNYFPIDLNVVSNMYINKSICIYRNINCNLQAMHSD